MATREKKTPINSKKQTLNKQQEMPCDTSTENEKKTAKSGPAKVPIAKKLAGKAAPKRVVKKPGIRIKMKAKAKQTAPLNRKLTKKLLKSAKSIEGAKKLLNGATEVKKPGRKKAVETATTEGPKKKLTKKALKNAGLGLKKSEADDTASNISDKTDISATERPASRARGKKTKPDLAETEDIDISFLEKEVKKEVDCVSDSGKSDSSKPKRLTKKQKLELAQKDVKKEDLTINSSVIDMLDLSVTKTSTKAVQQRRHSIEKFPIGPIETLEQSQGIFAQLPRSMSPRARRNTKIRQSIDGLKRSSPYTTRSDSPARMLRNGKQRKLKDLNLMEGLDSDRKDRKRRRLCSDLSGSEMSVSKLSGYESDSSFSDLASLTGTEAGDIKDVDIKPNITEEPAVVKRSLSSEVAAQDAISDSDNIFNESNSVDINLNDKKIKLEVKEENVASKPSIKLPEKTFLLDIMKQTFNNEVDKAKNEVKQQPKDIIELDSTDKENFEETVNTKDPNENEQMPQEQQTVEEETTEEKPEENIAVDNEEKVQTEEPEVHYVDDEMEQLTAELTQMINGNNKVENKADNEEKGVENEEKGVEEPEDKEEVEEDLEENEEIDEEHTEIDEEHKEIEEENTEIVEEIKDIDEESKEENKEIDEDNKEIDEHTTEITEENQEIVEEKEVEESPEIPEEEETPTLPEEEKEETTLQNPEEMETEDVPPPVLEAVNNVETNKIEVHEEESEEQEIQPKETEETMPVLEANVSEDLDNNKENNEVPRATPPPKIEESAEEKALKENILQALGLQSLQAAEEAKSKEKAPKTDGGYTGTLKTVIKINREKKKGRNSLKMTLQKNKGKGDAESSGVEDGYKIMKESSSSWKHGHNSSDTAGARHKSHYFNRSNPDGSSEHTSDGESNNQDGTAKALVIPEKASSFSIHPGRLCKDECSYCFGKFGLFDTPCHIAQMKNVDRQDKILAAEKHLTRDSCLCDACYRHVDRKSNTPSYTNKSTKRSSLVAPGPRQNHCHVLGCEKVSNNILRRKWIIKMRKSICQVINIDLDNPGLHSIPICDEHYSALEHLMVCAMCKRRLARNHIHYLGPESANLNNALNTEGIPLSLCEKPVVCKLCKCFAAVILKEPDDRPENSMNFFKEYKKRLLHFNDIEPLEESAAEEPILVPARSDKESKLKKRKKADTSEEESSQHEDQNNAENDFNCVDYNTLIPAIAMDCDSDSDGKKDAEVKKVMQRMESVKEAVEVSKNLKLKSSKNDVAVSKLGANPSISVRQLFPGEEDLPLNASIEFNNIKEKTPEGWSKCSSVIQYDSDTKKLWNELQKPYGNQSSFLRHLILLEKYFRNGELVLSSKASHHAVNYSESVQNRLRAYDNLPSHSNNQPFTMMQFNKQQKSQSGIITSKKEVLPPVTITKTTPMTSQLNSPPLIPPSAILNPVKRPTAPPGLISLNANIRPQGPSNKMPQSQKIKFPITKNWRPNLIPIDPTKKQERKQGLVQVISGGKPYHITFEDYKKMCAIKRSFEQREKNKRLQEPPQKPILVTHNSVLKSIVPRKGLIISKTTATVVKSEPTDLEKLDKHVENIGGGKPPSEKSLLLPKIPKSLTVIPQTVAKKNSRPGSPVMIITQKNTSINRS
ncbi:unnamed protein product [Brassicogethes aeneus]|uniref:Uncharacterized protein n=1 Tax=Brassicogethes aeneus TaxID=1431903 RepID=A0A9P0BDZ6_BRAAE|nr:unnamed protein product [Brassicogethes aeneus]